MRDFLKVVRGKGQDYYVQVKRPLDPEHEVCIIQEKLANTGRFPLILCPEIKNSKLPLVTDLFGSYEMLALSLGIDSKVSDIDAEGRAYFAFSDHFTPKVDRARLLGELKQRVADKKPTRVVPRSEAPVKEVILKGKDVDLGILPITRHGALDSAKYITVGCTICRHPDTGVPNVGIYRHELKGKDKLGLGTNPSHHVAYMAQRYAEQGKPMEVAIFLGHHPAVILGSQAKGNVDLNEFEVMGGLLGEPLLVTPAETVDIEVPAYAEIVIEGKIDPKNIVADGPFAEFTGHYGERGRRVTYVIDVTAITMRKDAIYLDLDPAHREHNMLFALFYESAVYDMVKRVVPSLKAVSFPVSGTCAFHVYISIKKRIQGEGRMAAMAALAADSTIKHVVVVDDDIDIYDEQQVLWAISTRVNAQKDITIIPWATGSDLDPSGYNETGIDRGNMTTKMIIDATKDIGMPSATRLTPKEELWKSMKLRDYVNLP